MFDGDREVLAEELRREIAKLNSEETALRKEDEILKRREEALRVGSASSKADGDVRLDVGSAYLILEEKCEKAMGIFTRELKDVPRGLYISRANPKALRCNPELANAEVCWLSKLRAGEDIPSIFGPQEVSMFINNFIEAHSRSIILLEGLEYLVSNNNFQIVLRLVQQVRDRISTSESKLIIPLNPNVLDVTQLNQLKQECHTID
ncbi:MAG: DUF835 domain-containing protein [Candidatus Altiarchaeota archaeon]